MFKGGHYRATLAVLVVVPLLVFSSVNYPALTGDDGDPFIEFQNQENVPPGERERLADERENTTVITSHLGEAGDIIAINPNGTLLYHNDSYDGYWDVDPSPVGEKTVTYTATEKVYNKSACKPVGEYDYCIRQLIERANLTTGETEILYSRIDPRYHSSEWHDADRIDEDRFVVGDMYADEVFVVNVTNDMVTWEWNAQNFLPLNTGGDFPKDWVHLNDVEVLEDGRIMVSLRNQDQVVFIDRKRGVVENWTLGEDDDHDVLYEQHNPDFIPRENGGPAVLVANSENNRIVEYQRTESNGWNQTWAWQDSRTQWPRDADRLPNGNTLITDSHGGRVIEVDERGEVVWSVDVPSAYEAERLEKGDESTGPSAQRADIRSRTEHREEDAGALLTMKNEIINLLPNKLVNGVSYMVPFWMSFYDLALLLNSAFFGVVWLLLELRWSSLELRSPVTSRK